MDINPDPYPGERPKTMSETVSEVPPNRTTKGGTIVAWVVLAILVVLAIVVGLGGYLFSDNPR